MSLQSPRVCFPRAALRDENTCTGFPCNDTRRIRIRFVVLLKNYYKGLTIFQTTDFFQFQLAVPRATLLLPRRHCLSPAPCHCLSPALSTSPPGTGTGLTIVSHHLWPASPSWRLALSKPPPPPRCCRPHNTTPIFANLRLLIANVES